MNFAGPQTKSRELMDTWWLRTVNSMLHFCQKVPPSKFTPSGVYFCPPHSFSVKNKAAELSFRWRVLSVLSSTW